MKIQTTIIAVLFLAACARAQQDKPGFAEAGQYFQDRLESTLKELSELRESIATEQVGLSTRLSELEVELARTRKEYQETTRVLDGSAQALIDLTGETEKAKEQAGYLKRLFGDYIGVFKAGLQIAERDRYLAVAEKAQAVIADEKLGDAERFAAQLEAVQASVDRIDEILGGTIFSASAVDANGEIHDGNVLLLGPAAIFRSVDGSQVGTVEQRADSKEPSTVAFNRPEDRKAAATVIDEGAGSFPLDPTLGKAHKMEATEETFVEHVKKGGPVMYPIFIMAALGLLIALYKWLSFTFIRRPSRRQIEGLLEAVGRRDITTSEERAADLRGPVGRMLSAGVAHMREPRELIEEVMYETVLKTRLRLERLLPFIAICAASAPLLGLLGTVTGIINTFKMITVAGSGDVKSLSGGISEALITTKFGLIVAIPSLLLHAFLSRKAKGVISQMETAAVSFVNQVSKTPPSAAAASPDDEDGMKPRAGGVSEDVRREVGEVLKEMLGPVRRNAPNGRGSGGIELTGEAHA